MRDRQLCAVTLAAASVPALLYLPRLGWVWATAAAAISALLLGLCGRRCAPGGLTEVIPAAFGRAGRAVLALVLLGGALLLGGAARALCAIYPESRGGPLTGLLLLLAAAYAAERGEETVLRSGAILFFFLTAVEAVILGFSAVQVRAAWLAPQTGRVPLAAMTAALSPMAVLYVRGGARRTGGWLAAGIGLCAAAALCAAGTLSPRVAGEEAFAVYTMAKSVSVFGVMERLEPVVSAALTAGGLLPACRSVPRQCEDGAGDRVEKAHRYRQFPARLHGVSCGHGPAEGGAGPRSRHMLGYCAIGNTMGSVRKKFAKKSKKCLTFGWLFDRIAEPLETGRQTTKDFERN